MIGGGLVGRSVWVATTNCIVASIEVGDGWGVVVLEGVAIVLILRLICVLVAVGVAVGRLGVTKGGAGSCVTVNIGVCMRVLVAAGVISIVLNGVACNSSPPREGVHAIQIASRIINKAA